MQHLEEELRSLPDATRERVPLKKGELLVDVRALCMSILEEGTASSAAEVGAEVERRVLAWRHAGFRVHGIVDGLRVETRLFTSSARQESEDAIEAATQKWIAITEQDLNVELSQAKQESTEALSVLCHLCATELRVGSSDVYVVAQSPELYFTRDIQYVPLHTLTDDGSAEVYTSERFVQSLGIPAEQVVPLALAMKNLDPAASREDLQKLLAQARSGSLPGKDAQGEKGSGTVDQATQGLLTMLENQQAHPHRKGAFLQKDLAANGSPSAGMPSSLSSQQQQQHSFTVPTAGGMESMWHHHMPPSSAASMSSSSSSSSTSSTTGGGSVVGVPSSRSVWNASSGLASLDTGATHEGTGSDHDMDEDEDEDDLLASAMRSLESPGGLLSGMLNSSLPMSSANEGRRATGGSEASGFGSIAPMSSSPPAPNAGGAASPTATGGGAETGPSKSSNPWGTLPSLPANAFRPLGSENDTSGSLSPAAGLPGTGKPTFGSGAAGGLMETPNAEGDSASGLTMRDCAEELASWLRKEFGGSTKAAHLGRFYKTNPEMAKIIKTMTLGHFVESNGDVLSWSPSSHVIAIAGEQPTPVLPEQSRAAAEAMVNWIRDRHGSQANSHALSMFYKAKPDLANVVRGQSLASFIRQNSDLMAWNPKTRVVTLVRTDKPAVSGSYVAAAGNNISGGSNGPAAKIGTGLGVGVAGANGGGSGGSSANGNQGGAAGGRSLASWIASENPTEESEEAFYTANPMLAAMVVAEWLQENYMGTTNVANLGAFYAKHPVLAKLIRSQTLHNFTLEHSEILRWNSKSRMLSVVSSGPSPKAGASAAAAAAAVASAGSNGDASGNTPRGAAKAASALGPQPDGTSDGLTVSDRSAATAMAYWLETEYGGHTNAANLGAFYKTYPHINRHVKSKTLQVFINAVPDLLGWNPKTHIIWSTRGGKVRTPPAAAAAKPSAGNNSSSSGAGDWNQQSGNVDWKEESLDIANRLASWLLQEKPNGPYKASMLGSFYRDNPEAAKVIKMRTLGAFCNDHPHLLSWNPKTYILRVKRTGLAKPQPGSSASTPQRKGPLSVAMPDNDDHLHALCVIRTWLLARGGTAQASQLVDMSVDHGKDYNVITLMGVTAFCQRYPKWLVFDEPSSRIILAELCSSS